MGFNKLHPLALGLCTGILSGLSAFAMGLLALIFYKGKPLVGMYGAMYVSFTPSFLNALLGAAVVSINVFIAAWITAWFYNWWLDMM